MKKLFSKKLIIFTSVFTVLGFLSLKVPFSGIYGSSQSFTLFDFLGPSSGLLIGPIFGGLAVFLVKLISVFINHQGFDFLTIARFFPMVLAAVYLGTKSRKNAFIPALCILLFIIHPVGRQAWYYSMYWLIPVLAVFKKERLILNALGATFTAHAIGSTIFLYAFGYTPAFWTALIPIVAYERGVFALGIWASYLILNNVLNLFTLKFNWTWLKIAVNENYILGKKFIKKYS